MKKFILIFCFITSLFVSGIIFASCANKEPQLKNQIITEDFIFNKIENKKEYELSGLSSTYSQGQNVIIPDTVISTQIPLYLNTQSFR